MTLTTVMKPIKLDLDVNSKVQIVRSSQDSNAADLTQLILPVKKILNIPIGDVILESDYETNVTPSFVIPTSFVRHTKKIGDEADISADYFMEDEDLLWMRNNTRISQDREAATYLGVETFEKIITLLEKHTGYVSELIPLIHAEKLISDKLKWPMALASKIVPDVYQYWMKKREKHGKPLCRKYWPSTSASDTNPHHTFRAREKDRYRLRKQQRKNDVESYRKMQQLRREFGKARELLQLVLERETLREAQFSTQRQIFSLNTISLDSTDILGIKSEILKNNEFQKPVEKHKLLYPHLLDTPVVPKTPIAVELPPVSKASKQTDGKLGAGLNRASGNSNLSGNKGNKVISVPTAGGAIAVDSVPETAMAVEEVEKAKERRNEKKQKRKLSSSNTVTFAPTDAEGAAVVSAVTALAPPVTPVSPFPTFTYLPGMPGPAKLCRPMWPSFMINSECREPVKYTRTFLEYLEDVELNHPLLHPLGGIRGVSCQGRSLGDSNASSESSGNNGYSDFKTLSGDATSCLYPKSFRVRGRVGRGGRYVIDRIPVYATAHDALSEPTAAVTALPSAPCKQSSVGASATAVLPPAVSTKKRRNIKFVYAARVPAYEKPHRGTGVELYQHVPLTDGANSNANSTLLSVAALSGSNIQLQLAGMNTEQMNSTSNATSLVSNDTYDGMGPRTGRTRSPQLNTSFPVGLPLSQGSLPAALKKREKDIYACSDSEDELVDYPRSKKPKVLDGKSEGWRDLTSKYYLAV